MQIESGDPLSALFSAAADAVILIDSVGTIQQVSHSIESTFGYSPSECVGKNVKVLMPEPDRAAHDQYLSSYLKSSDAKVIGIGRNVKGRKKNGEVFPMRLSVGEYKVGSDSYFVGICHDMSEHCHALAELGRAEKRYRDILENQKYFICRLDRKLRLTFANASLSTLLGKSYNELIGVHLADFLAQGSAQSTAELLDFMSSPDNEEIHLNFQIIAGERPSYAEWSFRKVSNSSTDEMEIQGLGVDVSDREDALLKAKFLKDHDQLTGLLRVPALVEHLQSNVKPANEYAFLCVDPDRLAEINHRYGYDVGNQVIVQIAKRMKSSLPPSGIVARLSGDELIMVFQTSGAEEAVDVAESLVNHLSKPYTIGGEHYRLNCKGGIALFPTDSSDLMALPALAEAAMLQAKTKKVSVAVFTEETHQKLLREIALKQELKNALATDGIDVYLQPKVCLATGSKCGYEALARWNHSDWGVVSPGEFVPVAEAAGMGPEFDRYILRKVAAIACSMRASNSEPLPIAVNITADHFAEPDFYEVITNKFETFGLPPSAIELEITEGMVLEMTSDVSNNLSRLRELGVRMSLDDFGTGYCSLSYLKNLDIDDLKIDKSFIDDVEDPKGALFVQSMIGLAKAHNLSVIAEGVETEKQAELLLQMGCDVVQGYLFSPPLPESEARAWIPTQDYSPFSFRLDS